MCKCLTILNFFQYAVMMINTFGLCLRDKSFLTIEVYRMTLQ